MPLRHILLVSGDPALADLFGAIAAGVDAVQLTQAGSDAEAAPLWRQLDPALVIQDAASWNPERLVERQLNQAPSPAIILLVGPEDPDTDLPPAVSALLRTPVSPGEAARLVETLLHLETLQRRDAMMAAELDQLRRSATIKLEGILAVLKSVLEHRVPRSGERAERIGDITRALADRFHVPDALLLDLELAAQLSELGRLLEGGPAHGNGGRDGGPESRHYALRSRQLLRQIPALERAADLVGSIYENWDGSGFPEHLLQGQIPLRSRILRVAVEYVALLESGRFRTPAQALEEMATHAGSSYDPMALVYLHQVEEEESGPAGRQHSRTVAIPDLRAGMVLADDLFTDAGIKLVGNGTRLTPEVIHTVQLRNRHDPIVGPARVRQEGS